MAKGISSSRFPVTGDVERLTHYLFRYPAKFHPRVVRALLEKYTEQGDLVLDPFCGSGTLLVEAAVLGRSSIGMDVDPIAVLVAEAKVRRYQVPRLKRSSQILLDALQRHRRSQEEYTHLMFNDLSETDYEAQVGPVETWIPSIPNLFHWFRRYVIVDLAHIRQSIEQAAMPESHRLLFRVMFASIIRNSSNADPVPVSGLEVTSHMKQRDVQGRLIDPFSIFERALHRAIDACEAFTSKARNGATARVVRGDSTRLDEHLEGLVDSVITSPPYHGAVDYYRRHQLEMFWLGQTKSHKDRLALLQAYIGRPQVSQGHPYVAASTLKTALATEWENRIREVSAERANAFRHYMVAMTRFFHSLAKRLPQDAPTILVVGHSTWNRNEIPTTDLFAEIAGNAFELREILWYPVKNRYMSYSRHNQADINTEYVLAFKRTEQ